VDEKTMAETTPHVAKLFLYPIKSLDPISVGSVTILKSGALKYDRQFALFDKSGHYINGKRNVQIHTLRSKIDLETKLITLQVQETEYIIHLEQERESLENVLGEYFDLPVQVRQNLDLGFPDDTRSPGPTLISTATLEEIAAWFPELDVEEVRLRFRANIEISGVPAFWEDRLFAQSDRMVDFQIGNVRFMGINPCQRCIVPTRNSQTGKADPNFQKTFVTKRQETLPEWVDRSRFNHYYRLAINTKLPESEAGKMIQIGDRVTKL
jgi:uncharacterized protein